jgi:hypothetical protein
MRLIALAVWALLAAIASTQQQSAPVEASNVAQSTYPSGPDGFVLTPANAPFSAGVAIALANLTLTAVCASFSSLYPVQPLTVVQGTTSPTSSINGTPVTVDSNSSIKLGNGDIALVQCDDSAFPGYIKPIDLLNQLVSHSPSAIVLFSNTSSFCHLNTNGTDLGKYLIYTMTSSNGYEQLTTPLPYAANLGSWVLSRRSAAQNSSSNGNGNGNGGLGSSSNSSLPGGPSPSTAVAMIILYSITGVITALFLIIIITGAVRAHRHPERYGPRNVLGRPRQSRARGLARAMLDTLPIVKFGEKDETVKPGDVELGASTANAGTDARDGADQTATAEHTPGTNARSEEDDSSAGAEGDSSDIKAAGAAATQRPHEPAAHAADEDNSLGCSICTEDFERGQDVRVLPCSHSFHPACIDPWLLNVSGTCPLW